MMSKQDKEVVLGLMAKSECSWRSGNGSSEVKPVSSTKGNKGNKFKWHQQGTSFQDPILSMEWVIYLVQGENVVGTDKEPEDQKHEREDIA